MHVSQKTSEIARESGITKFAQLGTGGFAEMDEPQIEPRLPRLAKPFTEAELAKELARVA